MRNSIGVAKEKKFANPFRSDNKSIGELELEEFMKTHLKDFQKAATNIAQLERQHGMNVIKQVAKRVQEQIRASQTSQREVIKNEPQNKVREERESEIGE